MFDTQEELLVYSVPEVARMLGLSRNSAYEAARRGDFPVIRVGKLLRIPKAAFDKMLQGV